MSLVGPRPERPEFVEVLHRQIPAYGNRLAVRPGITGLAQLNLPPDSDLDSVRRKVILDIEYIQTAGPWLDLRLIACTALRFLKLPILVFFGLHRSVKLSPHEVENRQSARRTDGSDPSSRSSRRPRHALPTATARGSKSTTLPRAMSVRQIRSN